MARPTYQYRHRVPPGTLTSMRYKRRGPSPRVLLTIAAVALVGIVLYLGFGALSRWIASPPDESRDASTENTSTPASPDAAAALAENIVLAYPTYLGGPLRDSTGRGPAPDALDVIWKLKIGSGKTARATDDKMVTWSGTGWTGQPTLVYEKGGASLLIGGYDHGLRRIDAMAGTVLWRAELDDVIKGTNTVYYEPSRPAGDRLVVVTGSRRGNGLALGDPRIAPLRAFSFATGEELWRLPVPRTENYSQDVDASPIRADGRLIVAIEPGYVLALDTTKLVPGPDGHPQPSVVASSPPLYTAEDVAAHPGPNGSNVVLEGSPAIVGDRIYIASSAGHVYGLDRTTLAIEWDFVAGGDMDSTVVARPDGTILVGMERQYVKHGGMFCLDPRKAPEDAVVWFFATEDRGISEWNGGVIGSVATSEEGTGTLAAFCSVDGYLYVVDPDTTSGTSPTPDGTGTYPRPVLLFRDHIGGSISTPAIVDGRIVAAGLDNTVRLYDITRDDGTTTITEIDTFKAGGPFESTPLVWEGRVYIGCRDGYLYCLGPK